MDLALKDKTVLVTGASGGIGSAMAEGSDCVNANAERWTSEFALVHRAGETRTSTPGRGAA